MFEYTFTIKVRSEFMDITDEDIYALSTEDIEVSSVESDGTFIEIDEED